MIITFLVFCFGISLTFKFSNDYTCLDHFAINFPHIIPALFTYMKVQKCLFFAFYSCNCIIIPDNILLIYQIDY